MVETAEATVWFDGGTKSIGDELVDIATNHDVGVFVVKHGDGDYHGGVPSIQAAVDGLEVAVPAGDVQFLESDGIDAEHLLEAEAEYWGIETIATPGHTPDNMSYRYGDVLLAADTVVEAYLPFAASRDLSGALRAVYTRL